MASEPGKREGVEVVAWAMLTAATIASAWCAYQASLWNGVQTRSLARASTAQFASVRKTSIVNRNQSIDVGTYLSYIEARLHDDVKLTQFLRSHARPEFKPALEAWIANEAQGRGNGLNPFALPEYRLADQEAAAGLEAEAASNLAVANGANDTGDAYVLHTVVFALSLFFFGGTSEARRSAMRRVMLTLGALVFLLAMTSMIRLPRAGSPPLVRKGATALAL